MQRTTPALRAAFEAAYVALNARDIEGFLERTDDQVEFTSIVAEAEGTTFRGREGAREWWDSVRGSFEVVAWELVDVRGDDTRGVAEVRMAGTLGGVPVEQLFWQAIRLRDARVATWWGFFRTEAEALRSVGLEP